MSNNSHIHRRRYIRSNTALHLLQPLSVFTVFTICSATLILPLRWWQEVNAKLLMGREAASIDKLKRLIWIWWQSIDNKLNMNYIIQSSTAIKSGPFFFLLLGWHSPSKSSKFTRTALRWHDTLCTGMSELFTISTSRQLFDIAFFTVLYHHWLCIFIQRYLITLVALCWLCLAHLKLILFVIA